MTPEDNTNTVQPETPVDNFSDQTVVQDRSEDNQNVGLTDDSTSTDSNLDSPQISQDKETQNETFNTQTEAPDGSMANDVSPEDPVTAPSETEPTIEDTAQPLAPGNEIIPPTPLEAAAMADAIPSSVPPENNQVVTSPHHKSRVKWVLGIIFVIVLVALASFFSYTYGKNHAPKPAVASSTTTVKSITLPPSAIVTAACVPGRGKQYIIPKDIPEGPIYDVENNKVIAIEYVFGVHQILVNSSLFSSTLLALSRNYPVDHFSFLPVAPQPGDTDQYVHLIMSVVSTKVSDAITCAGVPNASPAPPAGSIPATVSQTSSTTTKK